MNQHGLLVELGPVTEAQDVGDAPRGQETVAPGATIWRQGLPAVA